MAEVAVPLAIAAVTTALRFALQPDQPDLVSEGPRLQNLQGTTSNYGDPIPRHFGTVRSGGTVVWLKTTEVKRVEKKEVGGKGGAGQSSTTIQYEYFSSFAAVIGKGVATQLLRVWADQKIIYDKTTSTAGVTKYAGMRIRFYPGSLTQAQDSIIVADKGLANTPAYRDRALVVFENMPLRDFGNRIPSISVEVAYQQTSFSGPFVMGASNLLIENIDDGDAINGTVGGSTVVDRDRGVMFLVGSGGTVQRVNLKTLTVEAERVVASQAFSSAALDPRSGDLVGVFDDLAGIATPRSVVRLDGRTLETVFAIWDVGGFAPTVGAYALLPEVELQVDPFGLDNALASVFGLPAAPDGIIRDWGAFYGYFGSSGNTNITRLALTGQAGASFSLGGGSLRNFLIFGMVADKNGVYWAVGDRTLGAVSDIGSWGILIRYEMKPVSGLGLSLVPTARWRLARKERVDGTAAEVNDVGAFDEWSSNSPAVGIGYDEDTHTIVVASGRTDDDASANPECRIFVTINVAAIEGEPELLISHENDWDDFSDLSSDHVRLRNAKLDVFVDGPQPGGIFLDDNAPVMNESIRRCLRHGPHAGEIMFGLSDVHLGRFEWGKFSKGPTQLVHIDDFANWFKWHEGVDVQFPSYCIWMGEEEAVIVRVITASGAPPTRRWVKLFIGRHTVNDADLGETVEAICTSTNLLPADINRTELNGTLLRGFTILGNSSARQALYQLSQAFFFDVVESGPLLKFIVRDRVKLLDIEAGRTGAVSESASDRQTQVEESRIPDEDLPLSAELTYSDPALDYQHGHQSYQRTRVPAKSQFARAPAKIEFPIVLNQDAARNIAYTTVYERWAARSAYSLNLMHRYLELDPGDVIDVKVIREDDSIRTLPARVTQAQVGPNLLFELGLESYDKTVYSQDHFGSGGVAPQVIVVGLLTEHFILDLPALRSKDIPVFNGAMTAFSILHALLPNDPAWRGSVLMSSDDGIGFEAVDARTTIVGWGKVTSPSKSTIDVDPDFTTFHDEKPLDVKMVVGGAQLANASQSAVLAGAENIAVVGREGAWEIIGFTTVTPQGGEVYRLTGLLRGQRGTNYLSEAGHGASSTFILLRTDTLINERYSFDERTLQHRWYRADTISARNREGFPRPNVLLANMLRAWPVDSVGVAGDLGTDLTITWVRRTFDPNETPTDPGGFGVVQLPGVDQDQSTGGIQRAYDVEIVNPSTGAVVRTFAGLTTESATYTVAQRQTDGFNTTGATFTIRIYQYTKFGSTTHRGFPKSKTVSPFVLALVPFGNDARRKRFFLSTE